MVTVSGGIAADYCDTITGSGSSTMTLTPPGCEFGTIVDHATGAAILAVYPNPAGESHGQIAVDYTTVEAGTVRLVLTDGSDGWCKLSSRNPATRSACREVHPNATAGLYFLTLRTGRYREVRR